MAQLLFDNLEISQFRTFSYLTIEKLGQVNLIIGKNNVGKSTFLEALWLYANMGAPHIMLEVLKGRDELKDRRTEVVRPGGTEGPAVWNLFHGHPPLERVSSSIQIGRINAPDSALRISIEWFHTDGAQEDKLISTSSRDSDTESSDNIPALVVRLGAMKQIMRLDQDFQTHYRRWLLQPRAVLGLATRCSFLRPNGIRANDLSRMWDAVVLTELEKDVVESLRIIDPEIEDLAVLNADESTLATVRVKIAKEPSPLPLRTLGDGMNRLFDIGMSLVNAQNGLLLIDEIENGLHYSVLPLVWKFILKVARRLNVQVFATTHSYDCLKAFNTVTKGDTSIEGIATRLEFKNREFRASLFDETRLSTVLEEDIEIR